MGLSTQLKLFPEDNYPILDAPIYWPFTISRACQGKVWAESKYIRGYYKKDCMIDLATGQEMPNPHIKAPVSDLPWDL